MKIQLILLGCTACLIAPVSAKEDSPLAKHMEAFNDVYKAFKRESDPAKGAALAREAQQEIVKALSETPELVAKMPDGPEKAKAAAEYRKMVGKVFVSLCEVEEAYLAGKPEEVAKITASLKDMKKQGHDKFMEEE
jgi:hypothetical protein